MSDLAGTGLTDPEREELLLDYRAVAEESKYPPFSVPTNQKENDFLLNLSKEYESFVSGEKPYDSFAKIQEDYSEELIESRAWRSVAYSPEEAAKEVIRRSLKDEGYPDAVAKGLLDLRYDQQAKVVQMFTDDLAPWEVI